MKALNEEEIKRIKELRAKGIKIREISKTLKHSSKTILKYCLGVKVK